MLKYFFLIAFVLGSFHHSMAQFSNIFESKSLRLDYYHCGNADSEKFYFGELKQEPFWAGSKTHMVDTNGYGSYQMEVHSVENNTLLYSHGFSTLFSEWQSSPEAKATDRCFPESVVMPFPRQKVMVSISRETKRECLKRSLNTWLDPDQPFYQQGT